MRQPAAAVFQMVLQCLGLLFHQKYNFHEDPFLNLPHTLRNSDYSILLRKSLQLAGNSKLNNCHENLNAFKLLLSASKNRHKTLQYRGTAGQCPPQHRGKDVSSSNCSGILESRLTSLIHVENSSPLHIYVHLQRYLHPTIFEMLILKPLRKDYMFFAVIQIGN